MKIRNGFVSNSSSSSFIIAWKNLEKEPCKYCGRSYPTISMDTLKELCEKDYSGSTEIMAENYDELMGSSYQIEDFEFYKNFLEKQGITDFDNLDELPEEEDEKTKRYFQYYKDSKEELKEFKEMLKPYVNKGYQVGGVRICFRNEALTDFVKNNFTILDEW